MTTSIDIQHSRKWLEGSEAQAAYRRQVDEAQRLAAEQNAAYGQLTSALNDVLRTGVANFGQLTEALNTLEALAEKVRQANVIALHSYVWYWQELAGDTAGQFVGSVRGPFDTSLLPEAVPGRLALQRWALAAGEDERTIRLGLAQALSGIEARYIASARPIEYVRRVSIYG